MAITKIKFTERLTNYLDFRRDPIDFFLRMRALGQVVPLNTGVMPTFVINNPAHLQEILVTKDASFRKGRPTKVLTRTIGDGLLTTEKTAHKMQKAYTQPVFYKERLKNYAGVMAAESEQTVNALRKNDTCRIDEVMMELTLTIISQVMFATNPGKRKKALAKAVDVTIQETAKSIFLPVLLPMSVPTKGNIAHKRAIKTLETEVYGILKEARANPDAYKETMVGLLMDAVATPEGDKVTDQELRDQMMTMLLAGHETTANLLTWVFYLLAKNPEAEARFHEEIDAMDDITVDPFAKSREMPYTTQIIKETLRLYPPAWIIYREADEPVTLQGEEYEEGSIFMMATYAIHRDPEAFEDPEAFRPDRFEPEAEKQIPSFAYVPFGGGSRSCIGYRFAMMEAAILLAVIGRSVRFELIGEDTVKPDPLVSLRIKDGLRMKVVPRG